MRNKAVAMSDPATEERRVELAGKYLEANEGATNEAADRFADAMIRADELAPIPLESVRLIDKVRTWVLAGILTFGICILAAKKGNWKSLVAQQAGYAITGGYQFLGKDVLQGNVLWLALELDEIALAERCRKLGPVPSGFDVLFSFRRGADAIADLEALIIARQYKLVIVDMLSALLPMGTDSNTYDEVTAWMLSLRRMAQKRECCILALMHSPKSSREDFADAVLGSVGFGGQADSIIVLDRKRGEDAAKLYVTGNHGRDDVIKIGIDENLRLHRLEETGDSSASFLTGDTKRILDALREYPDGTSPLVISGVTGKSVSAVRVSLTRLKERGLITTVSRGRYAIKQSVSQVDDDDAAAPLPFG